MADLSTVTHPLIPSWSPTPIPNLSLSAGGLLALADLNTIAQRTLLAGGSSWLDALVLAPGLHYQQAAAALDQSLDGPGPGRATAVAAGAPPARFVVSNAGTLTYLRRLWRDAGRAGTLTLDVGRAPDAEGWRDWQKLVRSASGLVRRRSRPGMPPRHDGAPDVDPAAQVDCLSHILYLASPLLTTAAVTVMVLFADWWGLTFIMALIASRLLNIWSIKQRTRPDPGAAAGRPLPSDRRTEYAIDLGDGRRAVLRGRSSDLQAVTTQTWLRAKSTLDGYLEAASKLLVYMVAALSGNGSQAGAIILMALLLASAGLLGLSNAHARSLQMNGRVARLQIQGALRDRRARQRMPSDGEESAAVDIPPLGDTNLQYEALPGLEG